MARKLILDLNQESFGKQYIKDFSLSVGQKNTSSDIEYGLVQAIGDVSLYDADNKISSAIKNKELFSQNNLAIWSDYINSQAVGSQYIAKDSQYDNNDKTLSFSIENKRVGSNLDKIQYSGYQLRPYSVEPIALLEHILQRVRENYIPQNFAAWEFFGGKTANIWNMNTLRTNGATMTCHAPRGLKYGVPMPYGIDTSVALRLTQSPSEFTTLRIVARKGVQNADGTFSIDHSDTGIIKKYDLTQGVASYSFYGCLDARFLTIEAHDKGITANNPRSIFDTNNANYTDLTIELQGYDQSQYNSAVKCVPLGSIPYARLDKSDIRTALEKVCCVLQATVGDTGNGFAIYSSRNSDQATNNRHMQYYVPNNIKRTYTIGNINEEVLISNDYDSVDMSYSVGTKVDATYEEKIDTTRTINSDDLEVSFQYIGSASENKHQYAFIKKKVTSDNLFWYDSNNMNIIVEEAQGYQPYSANEKENKLKTITIWGGVHYFWGLQSSSLFFSTAEGHLQAINYPELFLTAVEPIDEKSCYILLAIPTERSSSFERSYKISNITVSFSTKVISYENKQSKVLKNAIAINNTDLICTDELANKLINNILYDFKYGLPTADIKLFGTDRINRHLDDIYTFEGNTDENGILKTWRAIEYNYSYDGAIIEKLKLRKFVCYKEIPSNYEVLTPLRSGYFEYNVPFVDKWLDDYRGFSLSVSVGGSLSASYQTLITDGSSSASFRLPDGRTVTGQATCTKNNDGSVRVSISMGVTGNYNLYVWSKYLLS